MTDRANPPVEWLRECFDYADGSLVWRVRPLDHFDSAHQQRIFNARQSGSVAGTIERGGYVRINLAGYWRIAAHRIIYAMHHGHWPVEVDHIDGDPSNNRIENLRAATHAQNLRNMRTPSSNTSGVKGVSFHKDTGKWSAWIRDSGAMRHLGTFANIHDATAVRKSAERELYGDFSNAR